MFLVSRRWLSGLNRCEALTTVIALFASTRIAFCLVVITAVLVKVIAIAAGHPDTGKQRNS